MNERIEEVLEFWFGTAPFDPDSKEGGSADAERPTGKDLWLSKSPQVARAIKRRFGKLVDQAKAGALDEWATTPRGRLALILVLDQFNRMLHRETPEAYRGDEKALALCFDGLDDAMDQKLGALERCFFYMPAMHAEDTDAQLASVEIFQELAAAAPPDDRDICEEFLRQAEKRREVVERFERFPHRNAILNRSSTAEESTFLQHTATF